MLIYRPRISGGAMLAAYVLDVGTSKSSPNVIMTMDIQNHQKPCPNPTLPVPTAYKKAPPAITISGLNRLKIAVIATCKRTTIKALVVGMGPYWLSVTP